MWFDSTVPGKNPRRRLNGSRGDKRRSAQPLHRDRELPASDRFVNSRANAAPCAAAKGTKPVAKPAAKKAAKKEAKPASKKAAKSDAAVPREFSKKAIVIEMMRRKEGATLAEIAKATGWQNHYADVQIMPTCVGNPVCGAVIAAMESA